MRKLLVLLAVLASCGKPAPPAPAPPAPASPPAAAASKNPPRPGLSPELAAQLEERKRAMSEAADGLPKDSGIPGMDELRRKLKAESGVQDTPSGPPSKVLRPPPEPDPPGPRLLVAANDEESAEVPQGWPLVIETLVSGDAGTSSPRLELPSPAWTPQPAGDSAPGRRVWTLLPAELDRLPRGTYRIGAALDGAATRDCSVRLVPARRIKNEADDVRRSQLLVRVHLLRGDRDAAALEAADLLKRQAAAPGAHQLQAEVLEAQGKGEDAAAARARARELDLRRPSPRRPPHGAAPVKNEY